MWTLDMMRRFVLTHQAEVPCPSCKGSHKQGMIIFKACLVIYPDWDDIELETKANVGCDVMLDRMTCFCRGLTGEELTWARKEAHVIIMRDLNIFLHSSSPKPSANPTGDHEEELALVKAY